MSQPQANDAEKNIEIWKVKKLIKRLEAARGNGTSMISLIIRGLSHDTPARAVLIPRSPQGPGVPRREDVG
jgi:peptide subunit release factor 1 (eRF1)